jgi:hypothetical protein
MAMMWNKKKPTTAGLYFYKKGNLIAAAQVDATMYLRLTNGWYGTLKSFAEEGEWYGPLTVPREQTSGEPGLPGGPYPVAV